MTPTIPGRLSLLLLLSLTFVPAAAFAAWPHDPDSDGLQLRPAQVQAVGVTCTPDGAGGAFLAWDENTAIYAQHVDALGKLLWGPSGCVVASGGGQPRYFPSVSADGAGGAIFAWEDARSGNFDIYVQRVSAAGVPLWLANGVALCTQAAAQNTTRIAADGTGGAAVAWIDQRSGLNRIYVRLVSAAGVAQGAVDGVELGTNAVGNQTDHTILRLPNGNYIIGWRDTRADAGDIYYQSLTSVGGIGIPGGIGMIVAASTQSEPRFALDSGAGVLACWTDARSGNSDIYAQRLGSGLGSLWTFGGVAVCSALLSQTAPVVASDGASGAIVFWVDSRNSATTQTDVYAQRLSAAGLPLWTADGVVVCDASGSQSFLRASPDASGGAIVAWKDDRTLDPTNSDIYAQRINGTGGSVWATDGIPVSTSFHDFPELTACSDSRSGAIIGWNAAFTPSNTKAVAAHVDEWGYLGAEPVIASVKDVPNDQGGQVKLSWNASPLDTDPLFRNISQYWLYRAAPPNLVASARRAGASIATPASAAGAGTPPRFLQTRTAAQDYYWEIATTVTATHLATYSEVVATTADSVGGSNPRTAFMVMARNSTGSMWWTSQPDSGYSVDNLPPAAPAPFTGQYGAGTALLHWNPNVEPDIAGYELYRGSSVGFTPSPANLVTAQPDTGYADAAGAPYVYKLLAVDSHGNRSPVATLIPSGTLDADGPSPAVAFLAPPWPNPSRSGGTLRVGLATAGAAKLSLYDAQGRCVRVLFEGALPAGEHAIPFDGRDDGGRTLAPGLYLARFVAPGFAATRRMAVID